MNEIRKKDQRRNINQEEKDKGQVQVQVNERRSSHTIVKSKSEKPNSRKLIEKKAEIGLEVSKNRFGNLPNISRGYSDINIHKREIKAHINTTPNENPNKDNIIKDKDNTNKYKLDGINKIKSIFILKIIFNYIEDVNLPYKLFNHSKLLQKQFNIRLDDYKKKYLEQLEFYKLKETIYFDNPLFKEIISKDTIYILQENIKDNYYDKLNESNLQYSSLYYIFNNKNNIDKLKNLNINFNKIKTMILNEDYRENGKENYDYFFQTLFLLKDFKNNLICLKLFFNLEEHNEVKSTLFESINDMKALRYLYIERINFNNKITIKLSNLKLFYCKKCKNVKM